MAVAFSPGLDDEEEKKNSQLSSQSGMLGGGAQQQGPAGTSSGRWTNMMSYVDANKNSDMGNRIGEKIGGEVNNAQNDLNKANEATQGYVTDKSLRGQASVASNVLGAPSSVKKEDVNKIKSFNGQGFVAGANPFLDQAQQAQRKVGQAGQLASNVSSDESLQKVFGQDEAGKQAQYGQGERNLDSFLLNNASNGQSDVQKIRDRFKGVGESAQKSVDDIRGGVERARQDSEDVRSSLNTAVDRSKNWVSDVKANAAKGAQNFNNQNAIEMFDYQSKLLPGTQKGSFSPMQAAQQATGMSSEDISNYLAGGGNYNDLLVQGDTAVADDYIDDDVRSRASVLSELGIIDPTTFAQRRELKGNSVNRAAVDAARIKKANNESIAASQKLYDEQGMGGVYIPEGSELDLKTKQSIADKKASVEEIRSRLAKKPKNDAVEYVPAGELEPVNGPQEKGRASRIGRSGPLNGRSNGL